MLTIKKAYANENKPGFLYIQDSLDQLYEFNIHDLELTFPKWKPELSRYDDIEVMKRSLYLVQHPSSYLGIIRWKNDNCDIPYYMFEPGFETTILPYCTKVEKEALHG